MDSVERLINDLDRLGLLTEKIQLSKVRSRNEAPLLALARDGKLNEHKALEKLAEHLKIQYLDLFDSSIAEKLETGELVQKLDPNLLWTYKAIPLWQTQFEVFVAIANPYELDGLNLIHFSIEKNAVPVLAEESKILHYLRKYAQSSPEKFDTLSSLESDTAIEILTAHENNSDASASDTPPIIRLCNKIIADAVKMQASDIHMEPNDFGLDVRVRIDGIMHGMIEVPARIMPYVTSRFKLLAGMDIAERRKTQDGRLRVRVGGESIDIRASCVPSGPGEKIVLRLLYSNAEQLKLELLGMPANLLFELKEILNSSGKCLLVTGPTGSGKSTTLYACLNYLRDGKTAIQTVENPVEYRIEGISQIQVNEAIGVTFASALRSVLRQDPDIILIGEIRDRETAEIAFQAAQTGHLVLSSLHTNDALSVISRLSMLELDPILISESVAGVIAQRLIRKLCEKCKIPASPDYLSEYQRYIERLEIPVADLFMEAGCPACLHTGFRGRMPIFSFLPFSEDLAEGVIQKLSLKEFEKLALENGYSDLCHAAIDSIVSGQSSLSEVRPYLIGQRKNISKPTAPEKSDQTVSKTINVPAASQQPKGDVGIQKPKVVLIEDDSDVRSILAMMLEREMYEVFEAENGQIGLEAVYQHRPTIVVCDLMMPVMDGKEFITRMQAQEKTREIPILILTAVDSESNEIDLLDLGAKDFVSKAASPNILLSRIRRILHDQ